MTPAPRRPRRSDAKHVLRRRDHVGGRTTESGVSRGEGLAAVRVARGSCFRDCVACDVFLDHWGLPCESCSHASVAAREERPKFGTADIDLSAGLAYHRPPARPRLWAVSLSSGGPDVGDPEQSDVFGIGPLLDLGDLMDWMDLEDLMGLVQMNLFGMDLMDWILDDLGLVCGKASQRSLGRQRFCPTM